MAGLSEVCTQTDLTLYRSQSRLGDKSIGTRRVCPRIGTAVLKGLTLLEPQSRFGGESFETIMVCPQIGTAVLKGLNVVFLRYGLIFMCQVQCDHVW